MALSKKAVWAEMARRLKQFHAHEAWQDIRLWGLFRWGTVSPLIKRGELLTTYTKENQTVWVWPSSHAYHEHIAPLLSKSLDELTRLAGAGRRS